MSTAWRRNWNYFSESLRDKNKQLTEQFTLVSRSQKEWQETFDCITDPMAVVDQNHTPHQGQQGAERDI